MKSIYVRSALWLFILLASAVMASGGQVSEQEAALLPPGEGRDVVLRVCSVCHSLERPASKAFPREEWEHLVDTMVDEGALMTDEEWFVIVDYLSRTFGPNRQPPAAQPDSAAPTENPGQRIR